jgi:hypothetical protein
MIAARLTGDISTSSRNVSRPIFAYRSRWHGGVSVRSR